MRIESAGPLKGKIVLPGDKSISHRAAMFAAMASGQSRIENYAASEDCASTLGCLSALGVKIGRDGSAVTIDGVGGNGFIRPSSDLDCGNSGTTMRLMAGILAGAGVECVMTGDASLSKRPMRRVVDPLTEMGAGIETEDGHAPLQIKGGKKLTGIEYKLPVASAQVKSCVLLAGLNAEGTTTVIESAPTRDHTERMLEQFGVSVGTETDGATRRISVNGGSLLKGASLRVPGDISAAAFFLVAGAIIEGSQLYLPFVGLNPTRAAVLDVLRQAGAKMSITEHDTGKGEPVGDIEIEGSGTAGLTKARIVIEGDVVANLVDEVPILAILGTQLEGGLEVRDAAELRVKETDRIDAVVKNLRKMGADIEEREDGFLVRRSLLQGAEVDSFGDHRIAMAFAVAGLVAEGVTEIHDAECAAVSFPDFFEQLAAVRTQ
ncbi:MAG: 3-phosphoshikimate 1-carboxyvinyltransferase [Acidobacteria bacterium]|nr:3-phosphoshikimate 1-carboxyvinyltransferase [Acidobacteriota bacterium]